MDSKTLLLEQIERVRKYANDRAVGSEEHNDSLERLIKLEEKLSEIEKSEAELILKTKQLDEDKKDRRHKNIIEIGKVILTGVIMPTAGLVAITAFEKDCTFTTALRGYVNYFLPKKL